MTSEQVMLTAVTLAAVTLGGCDLFDKPAEPLHSPYPSRHVWAVAPLRNESGSLQADGLVLADQLQRQLENATNLDVCAVNRVIEAMEALRLPAIATQEQAQQLMNTLGVDGLVVGTITAYDPYDPPKLGLALELYLNPATARQDQIDLERLSRAATAEQADAARRTPLPDAAGAPSPASRVSAVLDGGDPRTRTMLQHYAQQRGQDADPDAWIAYRVSMNRFSEFASYVMSWRLLEAERRRLEQTVTQALAAR